MPATLDRECLNMQTEPTKPKTTWDKGKLQQQALALPYKNPVEVWFLNLRSLPAF